MAKGVSGGFDSFFNKLPDTLQEGLSTWLGGAVKGLDNLPPTKDVFSEQTANWLLHFAGLTSENIRDVLVQRLVARGASIWFAERGQQVP